MEGSVFLIGYMCSGKTTLGKALAARMRLPFLDLDQYIEAQAGISIPQIFATQGEAAFRQLESDAIRRISARGERCVVACGGGTACQPQNMAIMEGAGTTVYLRPGKDRLLSRLMDGRARRPLLAGIDTEDEMWAMASEMIAAREEHYSRARLIFDSSYLETPQEIEQSAATLLKLLNL